MWGGTSCDVGSAGVCRNVTQMAPRKRAQFVDSCAKARNVVATRRDLIRKCVDGRMEVRENAGTLLVIAYKGPVSSLRLTARVVTGSALNSRWLSSLERRTVETGCEIPVTREIAVGAECLCLCCAFNVTKGFVMPNVIQNEESLLSVKDTARRLGVSRRTLEREVSRKNFPPPMKIGQKSLYSVADLRSYIEKLKARRGDVVE